MTGRGIDGESLVVRRGATLALAGVSLHVRPGQIHALVGLNGAGKTTLLRTVLGMLVPENGRAMLFGRDVATMPSQLWAGVGQMLETPFAYPELTAWENVHASARLHGLDRSQARTATERALRELDIEQYADRRTRTLSLGNRQRVGLAATLAHDPTVIILDEPSNALDPRGIIALRSLLRRAADDRGAAILVSSHHLDETARMADHIHVLHQGLMVGTLQPGTVDLERQFFDLVLKADQSGEPSRERRDKP